MNTLDTPTFESNSPSAQSVSDDISKTEPAKRVMVVHSQDVIRLGIEAILARSSKFIVFDKKVSADRLLKAATSWVPDVLLAEVTSDYESLQETILKLREMQPRLVVITIVDVTDSAMVNKALRGALDGVITDDIAAEDLEYALRSALDEKLYLHHKVVKMLIENTKTTGERSVEEPNILSARQQQVLTLIAEGKTTKQIGSILGISAKTVSVHRTVIMNRLNIFTVPGLVRYSITHGHRLAKAHRDTNA